jgi:TonB-dependent receptor
VPGGGARGTTRGAGAVNQIPKEFLQRIQVMKATTPDRDADAIGGTVDLQTSRVAEARRPVTTVSLRSSYLDTSQRWGHNASVAHAQPFRLGADDRRLGMLLTLNLEERESLQDSLQVLSQWPARSIPGTEDKARVLAGLRANRNRSSLQGHGFVFNTDLQWGPHHRFFLKTLFSERDQETYQDSITTDFLRGTIVRLDETSGAFERLWLYQQSSRRVPRSSTGSIVAGADHTLGDWTWNYSLGYAFASTRETDSPTGLFRTGRDFDGAYEIARDPRHPAIAVRPRSPDAAPGSGPKAEDFAFTRLEFADRDATDGEWALQTDLERTRMSAHGRSVLRVGVKARRREATNDQDRRPYTPVPGAAFSLAEVRTPGPASLYDGRYPLGDLPRLGALTSRFEASPEAFALDELNATSGSATGDFAVEESIYASYGQWQWDHRAWTLLGGLRGEHTTASTRGFESVIRTVEGVRRAEVTPVAVEQRYTRWFPGLHALHQSPRGWTLRASLTRTLQRPDFRDLSPSTSVNLDNKTIRSGNPALSPYDARALDLGLDLPLKRWGTVSLGIYYKRIRDFIVDVKENASYLDEPGFILARPINGSPAELRGLEFAWSVDLNFLPGALDTMSLNLNYTLTDSSAAYPGHPDVLIMLPEQVRETFNAALRWRVGNFSLNLRTRYRGLQLRDLIEPGEDQFNAGYWSHSLSASYRLNPSANLSLGLSNLNRPEVYTYQGRPERAVSNREGGLSVSLSLNLRFSP